MNGQAIASRRFAEADAAAERLLGFVRMAVALVLFAVLIGTSLSGAAPDDALLGDRILFAGIGMACYFLVGLVAVVLVQAGRHAPWVAWATAFADVSLICWNLWYAVSDVGMSSSYALAFPSAMMVPLILSFGALRFRPKVQFAATFMTAVVLAVIVASHPGGIAEEAAALAQIEVSYGPPPNAIRILMILGTGVIIALAVQRARRLLERVLREAEARANLTRFLPAGISDDMSDEALARLRGGRRTEIGVLFVDIRGFTRLSEEMTPEAVAALLTEYRAAILDVAAANDGVVDKFIGDGALVLFGLDASREAAARSALNAATALARRCDDAPYRIGVGVHFGEVTIGAFGDARRLEFTVLGAAVNTASRIEQLTRIEGAVALASGDAVGAAGAPGAWRALGSREIRGSDRPVDLWALQAADV